METKDPALTSFMSKGRMEERDQQSKQPPGVKRSAGGDSQGTQE